jgi:hypothetical protein
LVRKEASAGSEQQRSAADPQPTNSLSSIRWRRGPGRGCLFKLGFLLSSILSPLLRRGERKKGTRLGKFALPATICIDNNLTARWNGSLRRSIQQPLINLTGDVCPPGATPPDSATEHRWWRKRFANTPPLSEEESWPATTRWLALTWCHRW